MTTTHESEHEAVLAAPKAASSAAIRGTAKMLATMIASHRIQYNDNDASIQRLAGALAATMGGDGQRVESMSPGRTALYLVALLIAEQG